MGAMISANCTCGYEAPNVPIGGGMANHTVWCAHPAYCPVCKDMVSVNLLASEITCPRGCGGTPLPYFNSPQLQSKPGAHLVSAWGGRKLNDGPYLCPRCSQYAMTFNGEHMRFD